MRISLVGSDCEENLGLGMIAAALIEAGHRVKVVGFTEVAELEQAAAEVLRHRPQLVGLGIQFQHRAHEFLRLAAKLKSLGYAGHITCGGQYPTMAWAEILGHEPPIDSVVLHEGERTVVELGAALGRGEGLADVAGLAVRGSSGVPRRTPARPLCSNLDELPFAYRYREPARHLGLAFRPLWGSRGCWGSCAFCAISTYYRDARAHGGGRMLRLRSPESIAAEMAALWAADGGASLFCFHDDTLLLPRPADSLARLRALRGALDELGVGPVGIIGKCRPDGVTPELAHALRELGVVRMFVGVENGSERGLDHLHRGTTLDQIERALAAYASAGIFVCYNLLLFEPDATLDDVRDNIALIRRHPDVPVNFCRAEPYHGTPLHRRVSERGTLLGSYLGWDYRIDDDRTELAFRMAAAVFRERNFDPEGVANRTMGLGYTAQLLRCFYQVRSGSSETLLARSRQLIQEISQDTADLLERIVDFAETVDLGAHDRITRETALLGLRVAAHNRMWHAALDDLNQDIERFVAQERRLRGRRALPDRARALFERVAVAGCVVATVQACGGETESAEGTAGQGGRGVAGSAGRAGARTSGGYLMGDSVGGAGGRLWVDGGGSGGMMGDPVPTGGFGVGGWLMTSDGGSPPVIGGRGGTGGMMSDGTGGFGVGGWLSDPGGSPPLVGGRGSGGVSDPVGGVGTGGVQGTGGWVMGDGGSPPVIGGRGTGGGIVGDPVPTGGLGSGGARTGGAQAMGGFVVDCLPYVGGLSAATTEKLSAVDPAPANATTRREPGVVEHWRDTSPRQVSRSQDLPLYDPPVIELTARVEEGRVRVALCGGEPDMTLRWESEGTVIGSGREVLWEPDSADDALCIAARTAGGIAVASLRARGLGVTGRD